MHLEVVVEDTYFKPWESDFVVEEHTSVKVQVKEQTQPSKPLVEVKTIKSGKREKVSNPPVKESSDDISVPAAELSIICETFGVNKSNIRKKKSDFKQIVREYFSINTEYNKKKDAILRELSHSLK